MAYKKPLTSRLSIVLVVLFVALGGSLYLQLSHAATNTVLVEGYLLDTNGSTKAGNYDDDKVAAGNVSQNVTPGSPFKLTVTLGKMTVAVGPSGAPDDGWTLVGYTFCDRQTDGSSICGTVAPSPSNSKQTDSTTNAYLADASHANAGSSFSLTTVSGHRYDIRWIFKKNPPAAAPATPAQPATPPAEPAQTTPTTTPAATPATPAVPARAAPATSTESTGDSQTTTSDSTGTSSDQVATDSTGTTSDTTGSEDTATSDSSTSDSSSGTSTPSASAPKPKSAAGKLVKVVAVGGSSAGVLLLGGFMLLLLRRRRLAPAVAPYAPLPPAMPLPPPAPIAPVTPVTAPAPLQVPAPGLPTPPPATNPLEQSINKAFYPGAAAVQQTVTVQKPKTDEPPDMFEIARQHPETFGSTHFAGTEPPIVAPATPIAPPAPIEPDGTIDLQK